MQYSPLFAAAAAAAACFLPGEPVERLDLELSLNTARVHADTGLTIRVTATNQYWRAVRLNTTGGCVVGYRLVGPGNGDLPQEHLWACADILRVIDLAPGDAVVREYGLRFRPVWSITDGIRRWPSGQYQVVGQLLDEDIHVVRETKPVLFELVCHDPTWPSC